MMRELYLSPVGRIISAVLNAAATLRRPFMVYGYRDKPSRTWRKFTRVSSTAIIESRANVCVGDHVWIGHHTVIDGSNGVIIGRGCQISAGVGIFSHGSQDAIRLYGERYIAVDNSIRQGYTRGRVEIGEFTFVGARAVILPGVRIGKGALVAAGSVVTRDVPDFAIVRGVPARVVGDTRETDQRHWGDPDIRESHFDAASVQEWGKSLH